MNEDDAMEQENELSVLDLLTAPLASVFSPGFYRKVLRAALSKGLLYLLYLSLLSGIAACAALAGYQPQATVFKEWLKEKMPVITLTPEGAASDVPQPFTLTHPTLGNVLILDTTKTDVSLKDMPKTLAYMTKTKLVVTQRGGQYRVVDLVTKDRTDGKLENTVINAALIEQIYSKSLPWIYVLAFGGVFVIYFLWKVSAALFYSMLALMINSFRREKLDYTTLLNLCCFAVTPAALLQWISFFPLPFKMDVSLTTALLLTVVYLVFAILILKDDVPPPDTMDPNVI